MIIVRPERWLAGAALVLGSLCWIYYSQQGLILSHYDAKAHLVVARRVLDSITPGWQQIGAVWLPLPHLLQIVPIQADIIYRTGLFASLVSIVSFAVCVWAAARLVIAMTGSRIGAITAAALLLLNPSLLYLQSTPMTESLLLALLFVSILWLYEWLASPHAGRRVPAKLGGALFLAAWTRYEAWPVIAAVLAAAALARIPLRSIALLAAWPAAAMALFVLNSRVTMGAWFIAGGFFVPDPVYEGQMWRSLTAVWWGTHRLSGYAIEIVALVTALVLAFQGVTRRDRAARIAPVAMCAAAALPFYAFYEGHPFRMRYMVVEAAACAALCGIAVGLLRRPLKGRPTSPWTMRRPGLYGPALAALLIASSLVESPPLGADGPLVAEAQWDVPRSLERRAVSACLARSYAGEKIMASMGSLAHYMQELSQHGFAVADFLHEGNGVLWDIAMRTGPAPHVGWMLVEEQAEGGDVLARRLGHDAAFARGMNRICEGGGVALYQRTR